MGVWSFGDVRRKSIYCIWTDQSCGVCSETHNEFIFFDLKLEYGNKTCRMNERFIYFPPNTAGECEDHITNSAYFIKLLTVIDYSQSSVSLLHYARASCFMRWREYIIQMKNLLVLQMDRVLILFCLPPKIEKLNLSWSESGWIPKARVNTWYST